MAVSISDDFSGPYAGTDLPRAQTGPQPQYLLLVLLADYWRIREPLPSLFAEGRRRGTRVRTSGLMSTRAPRR